jgi:predicted unusual protein kinase regulating ubiquinone biosynthesis (AarF/ABC1/UbiB family)
VKEIKEGMPTGKVERAMQLVGTGAKIGGNYLKYYARKAINQDVSKETLHQDNAEDIYDSLSKLKGSALKLAQMLSMDKNLLPRAYTEKFTLSQYSAPPLSGPLVVKTFRQATGKNPDEVFESFNTKAIAAASIGQVHQAVHEGKQLAVKIQYPGVADSIRSDLRIVKPVALRMFGLSEREMAKYFEEVEAKLLEETDYTLELKRSTEISESCAHIPGLKFARYYPEFSSRRILTMDWMEGAHLKEFLATNPSQEIKNRIAQSLWDFYEFQLHTLRAIHADPHPGNFLFHANGNTGVIDFGCVKEVPEDFYLHYFPLLIPEVRQTPQVTDTLLRFIEIIFSADNEATRKELSDAFLEMTSLLARPFADSHFHFTDAYIDEIYKKGEEMYQLPEVRKPTEARGNRHALYINRTYFGLYTMLADLNATIKTANTDIPWREELLKHWNIL